MISLKIIEWYNGCAFSNLEILVFVICSTGICQHPEAKYYANMRMDSRFSSGIFVSLEKAFSMDFLVDMFERMVWNPEPLPKIISSVDWIISKQDTLLQDHHRLSGIAFIIVHSFRSQVSLHIIVSETFVSNIN